MARIERTDKRKASTAFTLVEVVMSIGILALVMGGMIFGYVQTNHRTEWSSMSLDAQSFATEAIEQARAAQLALGGGTPINQLQQAPFSTGTYTRINTMLIPSTGQLTNVVTTVTITNLSVNPYLYQFRADCVWYFPGRTNKFTNSLITWRAPDR
jgi:type II secretory pathway pseudopilin PulG